MTNSEQSLIEKLESMKSIYNPMVAEGGDVRLIRNAVLEEVIGIVRQREYSVELGKINEEWVRFHNNLRDSSSEIRDTSSDAGIGSGSTMTGASIGTSPAAPISQQPVDQSGLVEIVRLAIRDYGEGQGKKGYCFSAKEAAEIAVDALSDYLRPTKRESQQPNTWTFEEWLGSNKDELLPEVVDFMRQAFDAGARLSKRESVAHKLLEELLGEMTLHYGDGDSQPKIMARVYDYLNGEDKEQ